MEEAIALNLGMAIEGEMKRYSTTNFDMNNLNAAAKPADLERARRYRNETCIRKEEDGEYSKMSVCATPLKTLGENGAGLELYFKLVKNVGFLFFLISCASIYPIYQNSQGSGLNAGDIRQKWDTWHISNTDVVYDSSEISSNKTDLQDLFICDAIYTGIFIIFIVVLQVYSNRVVSQNSEKNVTLADYALEVKGIPSSGITQEQVAAHFSQFGAVSEVYLARSYDGLLSIYRERALLSYELGYYRLLETRGQKNSERIEKIIENLKKFDERIDCNAKNSNKTHDELPIIRGFVVFESVMNRKKCFNDYAKDKGCCKRLKRQKSNLKLLGVYPLRVLKAAAPSSIIWENLEVSKCSRVLRRVISLVCVLIALIASVAMVYALKSFQDDLPSAATCASVDYTVSLAEAKLQYTSDTQSYCYCKKQSLTDILNDSSEYSYCSYFFEQISISVAIRVSVSFGVIFVNFFIKIIFRLLSKFERVTNRSAEQLKLMSKVFIGQFVNTALVILAVNADFSALKTYNWLPQFIFNSNFYDFSRQWYVQVGSTIVTTMLVTIFSPHCVLLLTFYPMGLCRRHCCVSKYKTQREINQKFAGADFDLATRNSFVLNVVFTCFLYSGGMPIMNVICCLTMFMLYWVDKFLILRHYTKPPLYNHLLNERVLHYLPYAVIFHCGFSLYMYGATDIFPNSFNSDGSYNTNSLGYRIKSITGFVSIILAGAALLTSVWVTFYAKIFACLLKRKVVDISDDNNGQGTLSHELAHIRRNGLGTYRILDNPAYADLILALNATAENVKKNRDNSKISNQQ